MPPRPAQDQAQALQDALTTSQAARVLGLSDQSVRALVRAGKLPALVTPLGLLIDPLAAHHLVAEREQAARERTRTQDRGRTPVRHRRTTAGPGPGSHTGPHAGRGIPPARSATRPPSSSPSRSPSPSPPDAHRPRV